MPVLGAAGLSLSLAGGASATTGLPAAEPLTQNVAVSREITLCEEEFPDVSLATFYVLDKEGAGSSGRGLRLAVGCGGCGCGSGVVCGGCSPSTDYGAPTPRSYANPPRYWIPANKYTQSPRRKHVPKKR